MNALVQITEQVLSDREQAFVRAILQGLQIGPAAVEAGYSQAQAGYTVARRPRVQKALKDARDQVIRSEGATVALATMIELMAPQHPAGTRFNAAKTVLAMAGHRVDAPENKGETPLHEMDEVQLRAFIARAQKTIEEGGEPPVIHVLEAPDPEADREAPISA